MRGELVLIRCTRRARVLIAAAAALSALSALSCSSSQGASGSGAGGQPSTSTATGSTVSGSSGTGGGSAVETLFDGAGAVINGNLIAVDATGVYFVETAAGSPDTVWKVPMIGGAPSRIATASTSDYGDIDGLAVAGGTLYWSEYHANAIVAQSLSGGPPKTLAAAAQNGPQNLVVDATNVYWSDGPNGSISAVPLAGGTPTTVTTGVEPSALASDGTTLYFVGANETIESVPIVGGGAPKTLVTSQAGMIDQLVVSSGTLFWSLEGGSVMSVPTSGGTPVAVISQGNGGLGAYLAVDAQDAYVTGDGLGCAPSPFGIWSAPRAGGASNQIAMGLFGNAIVVDATSLYTFGGSCTGGLRVVRIPK
jgi:hypothetical protein